MKKFIYTAIAETSKECVQFVFGVIGSTMDIKRPIGHAEKAIELKHNIKSESVQKLEIHSVKSEHMEMSNKSILN